MEITQEMWDTAVSHAKEMLEVYKTIPTGMFGASTIAHSISLYEQGDRGIALYNSLINID